MAIPSELNTSTQTKVPPTRWVFHLTGRTRRQLLRGVLVAVIFIALNGLLAALFGVTILTYTITGLSVSSIVIVAAIGLSLLYGIRGFANFAHGDIMALGAYVALSVNLSGISIIWGAIVSFVVLAAVGILFEVIIFSRLEGRGPVAPIVASVGLALIIQNGIRAVATTRIWIYPVAALPEIQIVPGLGLDPIRHILTPAIALLFVISVHILLTYTNLGKAMRATADNLELAKATGIDTKRVTYATWAVSCSFASTAGVLLGLASFLRPEMGLNILLLIFAAVIVGGIGSPWGAVLGGLVIGLSQEMSVPVFVWLAQPDVIGLVNSSAYKVAIPFVILIFVLIIRPWGIAGRPPAFARRVFFVERITEALGRGTTAADPAEGNDGG
ncbi:MAG TPA: branched-chain amino acid ABC transporter permease [Thermoplasmata archaeon]|nr:branched-chain amino acid ABC transporter permease [Thermoplasmata archaeon]